MKLWITRDGTLCLHDERPTPNEREGYWCSDNLMALYSDKFPEVTFENSPLEIELKLSNYVDSTL